MVERLDHINPGTLMRRYQGKTVGHVELQALEKFKSE